MQLICNRGQPEVHDDDFAPLVQHNVLGLQVAMDYPALVGSRESRTKLSRDLERLVGR